MWKSLIRSTAHCVGAILVLPAVGAYHLGAAILGKDRAFPGWSQFFALIPGLTGVVLRRAFYRFVLARCEWSAEIGFGTTFSHATASIGHHVHIGSYCSLGGITIEDDCLIASHVSILNGLEQHGTARLDLPLREQPGRFQPVTIGRDSWIGERSIIAADIGQQCIIGAGAVVTRTIPNRAIAVGVPARIVRIRSASLESSQSDIETKLDVPESPQTQRAASVVSA